jgi:DNA (cytosine-5)-methyltransferase 3A
MKEEDQKTLTKLLGGIQPIQIDSRLVYAQSRRRLYWTNIPGVHEPDDRHISFQSILEDGYTPREKSVCLLASARPHKDVAKKFRKSFGAYMDNNIVFKNKEHYEKCKEIFFSHFTYDRSLSSALVNESVFTEEEKAAFDGIRYLYPIEMERLQTLPEGYCSELITNNQVRNVCGDGWTVDVIAHILSCIKKYNTFF